MTDNARRASAFLFLSLVAMLVISPVVASIPVGGTSDWTLSKPPIYCPNCVNIPGAMMVNYRNNLNSSVVGIVFAVAHNGAGQTVAFGSDTKEIGANLNVIAYPTILNPNPPGPLPPGTYSVSVFAIALNGVAISEETSVLVTVPSQ